ncbi:MAG: DUF1674 domain-containing protein [Rhizobiales bacterium]|jgi:hypothetical protein|nr:DUF1674 domain-containing protein [Hyphomicrobiales bacterium]
MSGKADTSQLPQSPAPAPRKPLSPAAERALAEAAARRTALEAREAELAKQAEINGRGGKDPVRYADWEVKGLAIDF